jgi:DNA-binding NarL/FixJ family response regulator
LGCYLFVRGFCGELRGDDAAAVLDYTEAAACGEKAGHKILFGAAMLTLADAAYRSGQVESAKSSAERGVALMREADEYHNRSWGLGVLSWLALDRGEVERAGSLITEAWFLARELAFGLLSVNQMMCVSGYLAARDEMETAARLLAAADEWLDAVGSDVYYLHAQRARLGYDLERRLGTARMAQLRDEARMRGWQAAQQDIDSILAAPADSAMDRSSESGRLSARETEVLRLLATGKTDQQIADALFISRRTATTHLTNILTKLEVANRTEAAAWAVRAGLA